jgi:hypothetical protein
MSYLFSESDGFVTPQPIATGPFGGLHGGAAAGIMTQMALRHVEAGFEPISVRTDFLRPVPMAPLTVSVQPVREGRRMVIWDVILQPATTSKPVARASVSFVKPADIEALAEQVNEAWGGFLSPLKLPDVPSVPSPHGGPWLMDAFDLRAGPDGVYWFKWTADMFQGSGIHWIIQLLGPADWTGGFICPGFPTPTKVQIWPNVDLNVVTDRPLSGDWIGLKPEGTYRLTGQGIGRATLIDELGPLGHVLLNVIAPS